MFINANPNQWFFFFFLPSQGLLTGTEKVSSIWNSAGSETSYLCRVDNRLRNILSRSRFSPVTLDTWKIGHILKTENMYLKDFLSIFIWPKPLQIKNATSLFDLDFNRMKHWQALLNLCIYLILIFYLHFIESTQIVIWQHLMDWKKINKFQMRNKLTSLLKWMPVQVQLLTFNWPPSLFTLFPCKCFKFTKLML